MSRDNEADSRDGEGDEKDKVQYQQQIQLQLHKPTVISEKQELANLIAENIQGMTQHQNLVRVESPTMVKEQELEKKPNHLTVQRLRMH